MQTMIIFKQLKANRLMKNLLYKKDQNPPQSPLSTSNLGEWEGTMYF